jgi:hypothetical protein
VAQRTRPAGAQSLPAGFEAKVRATWEAGYRAAVRDHLGEAPDAAEAAELAWESHGDDGTRWAP